MRRGSNGEGNVVIVTKADLQGGVKQSEYKLIHNSKKAVLN